MSEIVEVAKFGASPEAWDAFAERCGASFRCASGALSLWQLDHHGWHRMHRLDLMLVRPGQFLKIGQVAVGVGRKLRVFADSIQLLPDQLHLWPQAMDAVLRHLGAGEYHYGSQWNIEAPREDALSALPGVEVRAVEGITLDVVEFRQWNDWTSYFRAISNNAKRNAKRAQDTFPDMEVQSRIGLASLQSWFSLYKLKAKLAQRKKLDLSGLRSILRFGMRLAALRNRAFTSIVRCGGKPMAAFSGIDFGANTYFLEAGSCDGNTGTNWHLLLGMLERAFARDPRGQFVMGAQYASDPRDQGLAFSRRQIRVSLLPTSEVVFRYKPPAVRLVAMTPAPTLVQDVVQDLAAAARIGHGMPNGA